MKKIFAVSTAALAAMALIPTAVSFAAEDTVKVNFSITSSSALDGWYYYDFNPNVDSQDFTALSVSSGTATFSVDIKPEELATYGVVLVDANAWGGVQSEDIKLPSITASAGDTVDVTVKVSEDADGNGHLEVDVTANVKASADGNTPADGNTSADANTDTGVEGVAAVLGVAAVAAGAMIVAKKRK